MKILHCTLEYKKGVGGIKSVTTGLLPALAKKPDIEVAVVTPFYDVYKDFYSNLEDVGQVKHIFAGEIFTSQIYRACTDLVGDNCIYHYLIAPAKNSPVSKIFEIGDELNIYKEFAHSETNSRLEYFNGAIASMIRLPNPNIPTFDIVNTHTWHTGIVGCLVKEYGNIYANIYESQNLRPIPRIVSTVHMMLNVMNGWLYNPIAVRGFIKSIGLPEHFVHQFPNHAKHINDKTLMRHILSLLYGDAVNMVSQGLMQESISGKADGVEAMFEDLHRKQRLFGITNGIDFNKYDGTSQANLGEFALDPACITASKQKIKVHLAEHYSKLDPQKPWLLFVGRFASEKGVDMLSHALDAIAAQGANLIVMGFHVAFVNKDGRLVPRYQEEIDYIKNHRNAIVIEDAAEQREFGTKLRAAADSMLVLSHNEACGLVPMEGMANAAICVAPANQGLVDTVIPFDANLQKGTGFLYNDDPDVRKQNLSKAIFQAIAFIHGEKTRGTWDATTARIMCDAKQFDWNRTASEKYVDLYKQMLQREVLTADQVRQVSMPIVPSLKPTINKPKIFQIGFNKCGTSSLFDFFWANGVHGIHYGFGYVAKSMYDNLQGSKPLIAEKYASCPAFFDIENPYHQPQLYMHRWFRALDKQNPGSKFILNTRDKSKWLASRSTHQDPNTGDMYIDVAQRQLQLKSHDQVREAWSREWDQQHADVLGYFQYRKKDLLVYNIENDPVTKVCEFFKGIYQLDPNKMKHVNKTQLKVTA